MKKAYTLLLLALFFLPRRDAFSQVKPDHTLSKLEIGGLIDTLRSTLKRHYILPEQATRMDSYLKAGPSAGNRYQRDSF